MNERGSRTVATGGLLFSRTVLLLLVVTNVLRVVDGAGLGFRGIPGDYCRPRKPSCCPHRDDECTVVILDTLCYCDMFCDRPDGGDCCPDFYGFCTNVTYTTPQPTEKPKDCYYQNTLYPVGANVQQNCQKCQCEPDPIKPGASHWRCPEDKICLIQEDLLDKVNQESTAGTVTWQAGNYTDFWGMSLTDGVLYRLGTLFPERSVQNMHEIEIQLRIDLPAQFDARDEWPGKIHPVRDQKNCGASWAFSTTALSADRLAIQSEGKLNATLSPQQLLSCNQHRQKGCEGGYLDRAWWFIRKLGVVSEACYPYTSGATNDPGRCSTPKSEQQAGNVKCPSGNADSKIYKMTPPYRVSTKEDEIMTEVMNNGPVQATFLVHEDFFMYKSGVYQHTNFATEKGPKYQKSGYHSVRVLGWGTETVHGRPVKYWLCANSWGPQWGERGLFKILRGDNHCQIESFVIGAWGKGSKKRRRHKVRRVKKLRRF